VHQYRHAAGSGPEDPIDREQEVERSETAVQVVMVDLLAFYCYLPAASTLLRLLRSSEDEEVLIHLVKAIARVGNVSAVPRLTALLTHPNWVIRSQSAQALAALGAVEAGGSISILLDDESLAVRADAQRALGSLAAAHEAGEREVLGAFA
jgi:HEAT repeat protein